MQESSYHDLRRFNLGVVQHKPFVRPIFSYKRLGAVLISGFPKFGRWRPEEFGIDPRILLYSNATKHPRLLILMLIPTLNFQHLSVCSRFGV